MIQRAIKKWAKTKKRAVKMKDFKRAIKIFKDIVLTNLKLDRKISIPQIDLR